MLLVTFIPHYYLASLLPNIDSKFWATLTLQSFAIASLWHLYSRAQLKALRLFTQYFSFALFAAIAMTLLNKLLPSAILSSNFLLLFIYLFILLAIETSPHLLKNNYQKSTEGRVPALMFCVLSFGYFIIIPAEFIADFYQNSSPTLYFSAIITFVMSLRLISNVIQSESTNWKFFYAFLTAGTFALTFINGALLSGDYFAVNLSKYHIDLLDALPYVMLICALSVLRHTKTITPQNKHGFSIELYVFSLNIVLVTAHLLGTAYELPYIAPKLWQTVLVLSWFIISFILLFNSLGIKRQNYRKAKNVLSNFEKDLNSLSQSNEALTHSILTSEHKAIVNVSNNAILTASIEGEILSANPAAVQVFQALEQNLLAQPIKNFFAQTDKMHFFFDYESNVYSLQRKESGLSIECIAKRPDGSEFPVQAELQWAYREDSPLIVVTFINLTARKLAEQQALDLKDKFIANISHEFRTPLTIINGILDRYIDSAVSKKEGAELSTAKRNGLRLVRMVEQLLELSRITDNPKLNVETFRLSNLMALPTESFNRLALQSKLTFHSEIPDDLWIECDCLAFEKIIFNLLANAVKYTPENGTIKVHAYLESDTIILDIIDNGIGIEKSSQEKIFERFQRADDTKNKAIFGVGIGLSLVNELVNAHLWRINLTSKYKHGSKFSLSIPAAKAPTNEGSIDSNISEQELSSILVSTASEKQQKNENSQQVVLIIEDNADMQEHIKHVLEKQHHCLLAPSGETGLNLAQQYLPDIIVCDVMLTGIDGFDVLQNLKENEITAHIPVIMLTARTDLESRLKGLNLHADDYLSKPFNQRELLVRIDSLITNRQRLQLSYQAQLKGNKEKKENDAGESNTHETLNDKFINKLNDVIEHQYIEPELGITQMAEKLAMSERQLQRKIKVLLGTTPNNFIKDYRLKKALLLLESGAQIGRIAQDVGFSSQTYFGRCFKENYACTPKQYQQQLLESKSN